MVASERQRSSRGTHGPASLGRILIAALLTFADVAIWRAEKRWVEDAYWASDESEPGKRPTLSGVHSL
jgi:hypothetical protein